MKTKIVIIILCLWICKSPGLAQSSDVLKELREIWGVEKNTRKSPHGRLLHSSLADTNNKPKGQYTREDWQQVIDGYWGEGLSTSEKLTIFDSFWHNIDEGFACFPRLSVNWDSIKNKYRPEIENGVSRGRFAAILNYMYLALQDGHTVGGDSIVLYSKLVPGIPLLAGNGFFRHDHFGAALTPLNDNSLLVYSVVKNHPLELELGDRVIGYEGIPWNMQYQKLVSYELPLASVNPGSTKQSTEHFWLQSAGANWHLFDTIDIIKYKTADTLHLPTSVLEGKEMELVASEQLPLKGIPFPDYDNDEGITWGYVEGTQIAYIYTYAWYLDHGSDEFEHIILEIINNNEVEGLIIDSRLDFGGYPSISNEGLRHLFQDDVYVYEVANRKPGGHHHEFIFDSPIAMEVYDDDGIAGRGNLFEKPIAVVTGPGSISNGDRFPLLLKKHPYARSFGKPTNGAFSASWDNLPTTSNEDFPFFYADFNTVHVDSPQVFLTHTAPVVDEELWLHPDSVAKGVDNVSARAIEWIHNKVYPYQAMDLPVNYFEIGSTVPTKVHLHNPNNKNTEVYSYLIKHSDSSIVDSSMLSITDSNLYAGNITMPSTEEDFFISYKSFDLEQKENQLLPRISRLTSKGPVKVSHYELSDITSEELDLTLYLINLGLESSIENVRVKLEELDNCSDVSSVIRTVDRLGPGEQKPANRTYWIEYQECADNHIIPLKVNIFNGLNLYWVDTLMIDLAHEINSVQPLTTNGDINYFFNYPNPFKDRTNISFSLSNRQQVIIRITDPSGKEIETLANQKFDKGKHKIEYDASGLHPGIYFSHLLIENHMETRKMMVY